MATIREVKRRIKTSKNISQVTRAMEMVSAVKMRKAQEMALSGRSYIEELERMLRIVAGGTGEEDVSIFLKKSAGIKNILLIVMAPKKGLCGPLVGNLHRQVNSFLLDDKQPAGLDFSFIALGKKSIDIIKVFNKKVLADFEVFEKDLTIDSIEPVSDYAVQQFTGGNFDAIFVAYSHFINTMSQKPVVKQFLPISMTSEEEAPEKSKSLFLFEPSGAEVLNGLVTRYSKAMLYQLFLESIASEHSARMVAMRNANESAEDIISDLTLFYNKMRQNSITTELADSVSSRLTQV